ncbi:MAG: hypothetical protein U0R68_07415 [Candidatus Nanopelagicales bacterium]
MRIDRNTLRTVVPPVLALGLVVLVTHPVDAVPLDPPPTSAPAPAPSTGVAFEQQIHLADGHLRTAVLVGAAQPAGHATVVGAPSCSLALTPGVVGTLDCAYAGSGPVTVVVLLADGRRTTHTDLPVGA